MGTLDVRLLIVSDHYHCLDIPVCLLQLLSGIFKHKFFRLAVYLNVQFSPVNLLINGFKALVKGTNKEPREMVY